MAQKVGIVDVAMITCGESSENYLTQVYRVCKEVLDKAGIKREELGTVVSAASDLFHGGISCANSYYWDSGAAFLKNASRQDGESLFALYYAVLRILSGHYETALVLGVCKGSENPDNDTLTHYFSDPFYQRQLGLNESFAAALQMKLYMDTYKVTEEECALVAVKNLNNALRNPRAHIRKRVTLDDVMNSGYTFYPLKSLECAPKSEGFVAILLASEEKAKKLTRKPVWILGYGSSLDHYHLGDRNLLNTQLSAAAKQAYKMAEITNPLKELDIAEICEPYGFQELLWYEELGFCEKGKGVDLLKKGVTSKDGDLPVNLSGGVLATNPYVSRGLVRVAEVVLQMRKEAGENQLDRDIKLGLAHGTHGYAGQCHSVVILGC